MSTTSINSPLVLFLNKKKKVMPLSVYLLFLLMPYSSGSLGLFLTQNFEGGEEQFRKIIYQNIKYPQKARANCGIGTLKTRVYLATDGNIKEVEMLNEFGDGIEDAVTQALKETNGNWIAADTIRNFDVSFAFRLGEMPEVSGDIVITAFGLSSGKANCPTEKELLAETLSFIKKKKYKKALKVCTELFRRNPDSAHYQGIYQMIQGKLSI